MSSSSTEYFAARLMKTAIATRRYGLRDTANPDLAPFYTGPSAADADLSSGLLAANQLNQSVGLRAMTAGEYGAQVGAAGAAVFQEYLTAAGIETVFTEDRYFTRSAPALPDLGFRTAFVRGRAATSTATVVLEHLREPEYAPVLADADFYVRRRLAGMREYVHRLLAPAV